MRPDLRIAREHYGGHRRAFLGSNAVFGFGVAEYFGGRQHFRECTSIFAIEEVGIVALARALAKRRLLVKCII